MYCEFILFVLLMPYKRCLVPYKWRRGFVDRRSTVSHGSGLLRRDAAHLYLTYNYGYKRRGKTYAAARFS